MHPSIRARLGPTTTERLSIRGLAPDDLEDLVVLCAQAEDWEFEPPLERAGTEAMLDRQLWLWQTYGFGGCAVRARDPERGHERGELLGVVGLAVPLELAEHLPPVTAGWRVLPAARGLGIATEAAGAVLEQAFTTMGLDRVGCAMHKDNVRSLAVARRLGMSSMTTVDRALLLQVTADGWHAHRRRR